MHYQEIQPSGLLARYIKCYWALTIDPVDAVGEPETVLPDGNLEIVFNLADRFRRFHADGEIELQPRAIVVGQMKRFVRIQPTGKVDLFGVRFHTAGAYHFFKCNLSDLTGKIVELDSILTRHYANLEDRIHSAVAIEDRVSMIEKLLLNSLSPPDSNEKVVDAVKAHIAGNDGVVSIHQTARQFGVSQRQLERHFKYMVGVSPKFYSRIIRLQSIIAASEFQTADDLSGLALRFGFYDQPHFVREFAELVGKSPTAFLRDENRMAEAFIGS
ncbi:MAG: helix-turn-helix transcriptional regulator [Acidobacteria bacterium]|nr:helix-turn-helix transcriptional regulator [Acidobacteriota bacterium]MBP7476285.1 helix-turn-helix transcriptional regulator [Pyrinomonadaceae bacterium]